MEKAAFLDRDGVINKKAPDGAYITCWEDFQFLPGVQEAIALLNAAGYRVIVVSNQRGVAKGLLSSATLDLIHARMLAEVSARNACIDAIYYCPHELTEDCACRKPRPGMLLTAAAEHQIDLARSWMIGDSASDIEAGQRAGCKTLLITQESQSKLQGNPGLAAESLLEATHRILAQG